MTDKASLRTEALKKRDGIVAGDDDSMHAARNFLGAIKPETGSVIALYWPKASEFDTRPLIQALSLGGFTCALPVIRQSEKILGFVAYKDGDALEQGAFAVTQPVVDDATLWLEPDIFIVPLLAFDGQGHRLGYGAGYYDATLAHYRAARDILAIGYADEAQEFSGDLPAEAHDQKLDWVITPMRAIRF